MFESVHRSTDCGVNVVDSRESVGGMIVSDDEYAMISLNRMDESVVVVIVS